MFSEKLDMIDCIGKYFLMEISSDSSQDIPLTNNILIPMKKHAALNLSTFL